MERPVLILGAEPRVAVTIARSLHRHGIAVSVACCSPEEPVLSSRAVTRVLRLPSPHHEPDHFGRAVLATVRRDGYDMILPSNDTTLGGLAAQYTMLTEGFVAHVDHPVYLGCPVPESIRQVLDKSATLVAARRCGIEVPVTVEVSSGVELDGVLDSIRFPVIVKPRTKTQIGSSKIRYAQSSAELRRTLERDHVLRAGALVQEFCPGVGVGIELLVHRGEPVAMFQHRRLKELPASGGVSVLSVSEPLDEQLVRQSLALLREMQWEGVAMVEYRYDQRRRRAVLMEVNGRYWGSLALSVLSGLDFPYYEWQLAHGDKPIVPDSYRIGVRCRWTRGLLLRAQEVGSGGTHACWTSVVGTIKDLVGPSVRDALWSIRDPGPAARELGRTFSGLLRDSTRAGLKRLMPTSVTELLRGYRLLGPRDGRIYLQRGLLRLLHAHRDSWEPLPERVGTVLFICHGNILRSPMAATLLAQALAGTRRDLAIVSAGLHAKPYGRADDRGCLAAVEFGCSLETHESQMVSNEIVERADVIFVMDRLNEAKVLGRFPKAKSKVRLLGACDADATQLDITDPYDGELEDVRHCYERLARCVRHLATVLGESEGIASAEWRTSPKAEGAAHPGGEQTWQTQHGRP